MYNSIAIMSKSCIYLFSGLTFLININYKSGNIMSAEKKSIVGNLNYDIPASIVVFLVAVPLCLGIALASGAPLFSGIIAGIVGGIVVGVFSGSPLGVSGPAAGLAVIVLAAINELGAFEIFLLSVVVAGVIQLALGFAKAGIIRILLSILGN